jgi:hypothetical protein
MKKKKILTEASVLLIAIAMFLSTIVVTANTEQIETQMDPSFIKSTNPNPSESPMQPTVLGPILFSQLPFEPDESWIFHTSDSGAGYRCFDNFEGIEEDICDIHWWGLSLVYPWANCDPTGMLFEIIFWDDLPHFNGNEICKYSNVAPTITPTGKFYSGFEMFFFQYVLTPCCSLSDGYVSIQSTSSPNGCWLLWSGSDDGDMYGYQEGSTEPDLENDLAFQLTGYGEPADPLICCDPGLLD